MYPFAATVITDAALSYSCIYGFSTTLLDVNGNATPTPKRNAAIRRYLISIDRWSTEVHS